MTEIRNHDVVKVKSTNNISRIIDIHYAFDRYQIKGISGWQYGIKDLEKLDTDSLITTIESQKEELEIFLKDNFNLRHQLNSQKAITELAVKGLEDMKFLISQSECSPLFYEESKEILGVTLSEIERLSNAQT